MNKNNSRVRIVVRGVVQGVGFRPYIYRLACEHGLKGWVLNSTEGVIVEAEGDKKELEKFIQGIPLKAPPLAVVERGEVNWLPPVGFTSFIVEHSSEDTAGFVLISPDISICSDCFKELFDPDDSRFRYPFTNCTNCGPRFTIIEDIPYDRPKTTMRVFTMCQHCSDEYHDPANRRFHAQPNACPVCGPKVWLVKGNNPTNVVAQGDEAIVQTRELLREGSIVAIKGIGGFHLACDATSSQAVEMLSQLIEAEHQDGFKLQVKKILISPTLVVRDSSGVRSEDKIGLKELKSGG